MPRIPNSPPRPRGTYMAGWDKGTTAQTSRLLGRNKLSTPAFKSYTKPARSTAAEIRSLDQPAKQISATFGSGLTDYRIR